MLRFHVKQYENCWVQGHEQTYLKRRNAISTQSKKNIQYNYNSIIQ